MLLGLTKSDMSRPIYRIVTLERLVELFTKNENVLVSPSKWEDTFENFILKSKVKLSTGEIEDYGFHKTVFGQCWTLHNASDAMWRIYSPSNEGIRIKTTIGKLISSMYQAHPSHAKARCCIGKVDYVTKKKLTWHANNTFDESGLALDKMFKSLLLKRTAFEHENEVRLIYQHWGDDFLDHGLYSYKIDPHKLVDEIMIDPRRSYSEFQTIKLIIERSTKYKGKIKRSLLYQFPKDMVLTVTDDFGLANDA